MTTRSFDTIPGVQSQHFYGTYLYGVLTDTRLTTLKNAFWHYLQTFRNHIRPDFLSSCIFFLLFLCQKVLTFSANLRNYIRLQQECISTEQPRVICAKKHKLKKVGIFSANLINHIHPHPWHICQCTMHSITCWRRKAEKMPWQSVFAEKCNI